MIKKTIIGITTFSMLALGAAVFAQSDNPDSAASVQQKMILQVEPNGKAILRGTVDSVSSDTITLKSWGGDWTIKVSSATKIIPASLGNDITKIKTGDFVGVSGTVSQGAWTIDAKSVRDWSLGQQISQEKKENNQEIKNIKKGTKPRNYQGTASNLSSNGTSFSLISEGTTYTVNVASGAKLLNKNKLTIAATDIQNGDSLRVWGTNSNGTITASIVRDVSIPR